MTSIIQKLSRLKRASYKRYGKAPHKPILLLAIIELIEEGQITENRIRITPELVATFQKIWHQIVPINTWQARFYLPFYHLTGDGFWHLEALNGAELTLTKSYSPKSLQALYEVIEYAYFDEELWEQLCNKESREIFKSFLLKTYFNSKLLNSSELDRDRRSYLKGLELEFEGALAAEDQTEEYQEIRSALFKNRVPKIYEYRCAISGLQISAIANVAMVDACHIQPWHLSKNDTIQNGICLTPTVHRAFDRGLLSISNDYRVIVSPRFTESYSSYSLHQFENREVYLPDNKEYYPSQEMLAWHRKKFKFQ